MLRVWCNQLRLPFSFSFGLRDQRRRNFCEKPSWVDRELPQLHRRRLVITGMGVATPLGNSVSGFWNALLAGKSGVDSLIPLNSSSQEDTGRYPHAHLFSKEFLDKCGTSIAATIKEPIYIDKRDQREIPLFVAYGQHAALQALQESRLLHHPNPESLGVVMGTGVGNLEDISNAAIQLEQNLVKKISPYFVGRILPSSPAGWIGKGMRLPPSFSNNIADSSVPFEGAVLGNVAACATGQLSIIQGAQLMFTDPSLKIVLCGATEAAIHPISVAGFSRMRALSRGFNERPEKASRPFEAKRDGFVMGEGAGAICLEDRDHAIERGVPILAELRGFGISCDGHHMSQPPKDGRGAKLAMKKTLELSGLSAEEIQYIAAHGTSTPLGDLAETEAIQSVFGKHSEQVRVSSIKGNIGHLLGAAGIVQIIAAVQSIRHDTAPPTLNLETPGESCTLNYVPNQPEQFPINAVLSNSFGFGGMNTCVALTKHY